MLYLRAFIFAIIVLLIGISNTVSANPDDDGETSQQDDFSKLHDLAIDPSLIEMLRDAPSGTVFLGQVWLNPWESPGFQRGILNSPGGWRLSNKQLITATPLIGADKLFSNPIYEKLPGEIDTKLYTGEMKVLGKIFEPSAGYYSVSLYNNIYQKSVYAAVALGVDKSVLKTEASLSSLYQQLDHTLFSKMKVASFTLKKLSDSQVRISRSAIIGNTGKPWAKQFSSDEQARLEKIKSKPQSDVIKDIVSRRVETAKGLLSDYNSRLIEKAFNSLNSENTSYFLKDYYSVNLPEIGDQAYVPLKPKNEVLLPPPPPLEPPASDGKKNYLYDIYTGIDDDADQIIEDNADYLFNKDPQNTKFISYNADQEQFEDKQRNKVTLTENDRLYVVAHSMRVGPHKQITLNNGLSGYGLSEQLKKLAPENKKMGSISLVSCRLEEGSNLPESTGVLQKGFSHDLITGLRLRGISVEQVSARTMLVQIDPSGRKWYSHRMPDGSLIWANEGEPYKIIAHFDTEKGEIVYETVLMNKPSGGPPTDTSDVLEISPELKEAYNNKNVVKTEIDIIASAWKTSVKQLLTDHNLDTEKWIMDIHSTQALGEDWLVKMVHTETEEIQGFIVSDPVFMQLKALVDKHFSVLKTPIEPAPNITDPGEAEGVDLLNEAFAAQYLFNFFRQKQVNDRADTALNSNLHKALQIQAWLRASQMFVAEMQNVLKIASVVKILKSDTASVDELLKGARPLLKNFKVAGNILAGVDTVFNAANVGFDIYELSVAQTEAEKATTGTQLAFDSVSLGLSATSLATMALSSSSSAFATAMAAAIAPTTEVLGPLGVPLAGIGIGVTALVEAFEDNLNDVKNNGIYFSHLDADYSRGGYTYKENGKDILDFAHVGFQKKDGKISYARYNQAIINGIDLHNNQLTYGTQYTWQTERCEDADDSLLSAFAPNPRPLKNKPKINIRAGIGHDQHLDFTPQETIVLPVTMPSTIDYRYQMAWVLYRHDTGFDVLRRLEQHACFIFDYYMCPSQYAINSLDFHYNNSHQVDVHLDNKKRTLLNMGAPTQWRGKTVYHLYGDGGQYTLRPANQWDRYNIHSSDSADESWAIDASYTSTAHITQGSDHGNNYSEFIIGDSKVWLSGDKWVYVHTKDSSRDMVNTVVRINSQGQIETVSQEVDYTNFAQNHPHEALSEYLNGLTTVPGSAGTIRIDHYATKDDWGTVVPVAWYLVKEDVYLYPDLRRISYADAKNDMQLVGYWKTTDDHIESWHFSLSRGEVYRTLIKGDQRKTQILGDGDLLLGYSEGIRELYASPSQVQVRTANDLYFTISLKDKKLSAKLSKIKVTDDYFAKIFAYYADLESNNLDFEYNGPALTWSEIKDIGKKFMATYADRFTRAKVIQIDINHYTYWYISATEQLIRPGKKWWPDDSQANSTIPAVLVSWQGNGSDMNIFWYASTHSTTDGSNSQHNRLYYQKGAGGKAQQVINEDIVAVYNGETGVVAVTATGLIYLVNAQNQLTLIGVTDSWLSKHTTTQGDSLKTQLDTLLNNNNSSQVLSLKYIRNTSGHFVEGWYDSRANVLVFANSSTANNLRYSGYDSANKKAWLFDKQSRKLYRAATIKLEANQYATEESSPTTQLAQTSTKLLSAYSNSDAFIFFDGGYDNALTPPTLSIATRDSDVASSGSQEVRYTVTQLTGDVHEATPHLEWTPGTPAPELKTELNIDDAFFNGQTLILSHQHILYHYQGATSGHQGQQASNNAVIAGIAWPGLIKPLEQCTNTQNIDKDYIVENALIIIRYDIPSLDTKNIMIRTNAQIECLSNLLNQVSDLEQSPENTILPIYGNDQKILGWYDRHEKAFIPQDIGANLKTLRYLGTTPDKRLLYFNPDASMLYKTDLDGSNAMLGYATDVMLNKDTLIYTGTDDYINTISPPGSRAKNLMLTGKNNNDMYLLTPENMRDKNAAFIFNYATDDTRDMLNLSAFSPEDFTVFTYQQDFVFHYHKDDEDFYIVVKNQLSDTKLVKRWQRVQVEFKSDKGLYWLTDIIKAINNSNQHHTMKIKSGKLFLYSGCQQCPVPTVDTLF